MGVEKRMEFIRDSLEKLVKFEEADLVINLFKCRFSLSEISYFLNVNIDRIKDILIDYELLDSEYLESVDNIGEIKIDNETRDRLIIEEGNKEEKTRLAVKSHKRGLDIYDIAYISNLSVSQVRWLLSCEDVL